MRVTQGAPKRRPWAGKCNPFGITNAGRPAHGERWQATQNDKNTFAVGVACKARYLRMMCVVFAIHHFASGNPMRRNQRKWAITPSRNDLCSVYVTPKSRHVCSTTFEIAG